MNPYSNLFFTEIDFCIPDVLQGLLLNFSLLFFTILVSVIAKT